MRRLPAAVSGRSASERYPAQQGYEPDAAGNHGGYRSAVATYPVPSAAGFVLPAIRPVVRGYSVPVADSRRFAGASGLIITVVTDLPQIEWGLKAESLTAVYQFAPAFVELRCLATLLFCQWPDDAIQRTAAAQFFKAVSSVTSGSADGLPPYISTVWSPSASVPGQPRRNGLCLFRLAGHQQQTDLRRQNGP